MAYWGILVNFIFSWKSPTGETFFNYFRPGSENLNEILENHSLLFYPQGFQPSVSTSSILVEKISFVLPRKFIFHGLGSRKLKGCMQSTMTNPLKSKVVMMSSCLLTIGATKKVNDNNEAPFCINNKNFITKSN